MATGVDNKLAGLGGLTALDSLKESRRSQVEKSSGESFEKTLREQVNSIDVEEEMKNSAPMTEKPILKFSNHALERMSSRGIHFTPEQITKIEQGMQKATEKGSKEALVLTDDSALIVSLKNSTVVTVMDKTMMKENVFTNIDSTVFV